MEAVATSGKEQISRSLYYAQIRCYFVFPKKGGGVHDVEFIMDVNNDWDEQLYARVGDGYDLLADNAPNAPRYIVDGDKALARGKLVLVSPGTKGGFMRARLQWAMPEYIAVYESGGKGTWVPVRNGIHEVQPGRWELPIVLEGLGPGNSGETTVEIQLDHVPYTAPR